MSLEDPHLRASDLVALILNPSLLTGIFFCLLAVKFEPGGIYQVFHAAVSVIITALIPIGLIFILKARGKLSDVEMSIRSERERVYLVCGAGYATGTVLLLSSGAAWPLWGFMALHVPNTLLLLAFNRWIKVSIHSMVLTSLFVGGLMLFGSQALPFGILVLTASWARWDAGIHTAVELVCGVSVGAVLTPIELCMLRAYAP